MTLRAAARACLSSPGPTAAVEIAPDGVTAVALRFARSGPELLGHARAALPAGAILPGVMATNVMDREGLADAVRDVLSRLPRRPGRVGLAVPDAAVRVSLVRFASPPARTADLASLIRWQVGKSAPFKLEDAQIAYTAGAALADGGREYVVVAARRAIVAEYERPCLAAGVRPGLVDLTAFGLVNGCLAGRPPQPAGDWLLAHAAPGYNSVAIVSGGDLVCFRNRPGDGAGDLADLVHQTVMYYEDRLGGAGIGVIRVAARDSVDVLQRTLAERVGAPVETVRARVASPPGSAGETLSETLAAPIGMLLRDRRRAA